MILKKYYLSFMTNSYLTSQVLMNTNTTSVSMKAGYRWKEEPENCTGIKKTIRYESRKVEEKKYRALRPVSDEKKTYLAGATETNLYIFWPY